RDRWRRALAARRNRVACRRADQPHGHRLPRRHHRARRRSGHARDGQRTDGSERAGGKAGARGAQSRGSAAVRAILTRPAKNGCRVAMARPKEFDRDAVLDRAVELFWAKGYEATSLGDLVESLGVGKQSLYDTFGDKHALYLAALDRYCEKYGGLPSDPLHG